ncbi:MAG: hypothetical protein IT428_26580 [Planctomycetaceae bacterium]|nr:hypothetical protein [Planctomycetaceae bacterium]
MENRPPLHSLPPEELVFRVTLWSAAVLLATYVVPVWPITLLAAMVGPLLSGTAVGLGIYGSARYPSLRMWRTTTAAVLITSLLALQLWRIILAIPPR